MGLNPDASIRENCEISLVDRRWASPMIRPVPSKLSRRLLLSIGLLEEESA